MLFTAFFSLFLFFFSFSCRKKEPNYFFFTIISSSSLKYFILLLLYFLVPFDACKQFTYVYNYINNNKTSLENQFFLSFFHFVVVFVFVGGVQEINSISFPFSLIVFVSLSSFSLSFFLFISKLINDQEKKRLLFFYLMREYLKH